MKMHLFGKHLHSQIVWPLALASIIISIVATVVGVGIIGRVVEQWIDGNANSAAELLVSRIDRRTFEAQRSLGLVAGNPTFVDDVSSSDATAVARTLLEASDVLDADSLMLLDRSGVVVASVGSLRVAPGERPFAGGTVAGGPGGAAMAVAHVDDQHAIAVTQEIDMPDGTSAYLVRSTMVDNEYMAELVSGLSSGIAVLDENGRPLAAALPESLESETLLPALVSNAPGVSGIIADLIAGDATSAAFDVDGVEYRMAVRKLRFAGDSVGPDIYVATVVGTDIAAQTRRTTTNLILMWSLVAALALVGLNWWVARGVSDPLGELAGSVARVAEGDYSTKVAIRGSAEVSDLADNFNVMTDSLRERSESLTKKVLELATLYEMSRALGTTLDLDVLLDSVLDSAMRIFAVELGYVAIVDRETGALAIRTWRGADVSPASAMRVRSSMSEWVVREGRPLIFNPSRTDAGEGEHEDSVTGALAALCVPLLSTEGTIGAITVGSRDEERRFTSDDVRLLATIANHVTIAIGNIGLFSSVQEAYLATVRALAAAVDAKDPYTRGHSDGVAAFALMIGNALALSPEQMIALEMAAYLHDIGKIGISEDILLKPGKLTESEMSRMRHHPLIGANILKPVAFPWPIAPVVRHHHEHVDGGGYPAGLRSEEIPLLARVLTVADAFEAMIADRPYRRGRSQQEAILELRRCSGTHFDPRVVEAFIGVLDAMEDVSVDAAPTGLEVGPEELEAVYVAVCDGMFASFRKLGGPRLANNLEHAVNERLLAEGVPLSLQAGHLVVDDAEMLTDDALEAHLKCAVSAIAQNIESASGTGLADHFLAEALESLPERMRAHATQLGFQTST